MADRQETVHVVLKSYWEDLGKYTRKVTTAAKVFDDRDDARDYAQRMNDASNVYEYKVQSCKKG